MKRCIQLTVNICIIGGLLFCQNKQVNMKQFKEWSVDKQVEYINQLDQKKKVEFISRLIPGSDFIAPPNEELRFLQDGRIIVHSLNESGIDKLNLAYWRYENDSIVFYKSKNSVLFPYLKRKVIIDDCIVDKGATSDSDLGIRFKSISSSENDIYLIYMKYKSPVFDVPNKKRIEKLLKESK